MCLFMKSVSCSMYSFVRFEYSNSIGRLLCDGWLANGACRVDLVFGQGIPSGAGDTVEGVHQILRERSHVHFLHRALQSNRPVGSDLDAERAAGHPNLHQTVVAEAVSDSGASHGARRGSGGQRVARASLPDQDVDAGPRDNTGPLHVEAVRT